MAIIDKITLDENSRNFYDKKAYHNGDGLPYSTEIPIVDNYSGFKIIVTEEDPEIRKDGYVYFIAKPHPIKNWLKFTSEESLCSVRIVWSSDSGVPEEFINLEYSSNGINWYPFNVGVIQDGHPIGGTVVTLVHAGDHIWVKGNNSIINNYSFENYYKFVINGSMSSSGDITSIIDENCEIKEVSKNCSLCKLFENCNTLINPPELPILDLSEYCYADMFKGCSSLISHPELPARELKKGCYKGMFDGCSSLYVSDETGSNIWNIPYDEIAIGDYVMEDMFKGCDGSRSTDSPNFNGIKKTYYTS